jgi:predicted nucleic acid-binding protein
VRTLVVDASVAVKWVVEEPGTQEAVALRAASRLLVPDLLVAECANILWKKVQRQELTPQEAFLAASLLERADVELLPGRAFLEAATRIAIQINHPAYDCVYVALALENDCSFVTADQRLVTKLDRGPPAFRGRAIALAHAAQM